MGYTHYWRQPKTITKHDMEQIVGDFLKVSLKFEDFELTKKHKDAFIPYSNTEMIIFNGTGNSSGETFIFKRKNENTDLHFCKTKRKPYDLAVCCFLLIAKQHLKDSVHVTTDGSQYHWQKAIDTCAHMLGYEYKKFDVTDKRRIRYRYWE